MIKLHLIPLLPLLGAAFCLIGARTWRRATVEFVSCGVVLAAFIVGVDAFRQMPEGGALRDIAYSWISSGDLAINVGFTMDWLSGTLVLVITGIGFLIHLYSTGYMHDDPGYARYFGYLNLFTGSMLILVLADSLPLMFVGWEGVGACSYLLIGFWFGRTENADAGRKAFLVNRIGDAGFILGVLIIWTYAGTVELAGLEESTAGLETGRLLGQSTVLWAALLLLVGATGKSAQIPLYVWLPDAMAGPTPVSALIHAATMVTAGVYMVARLHFLYALAPSAMMTVAFVGAGTALFAAVIGFAQQDIKKVLAYSTISQLGYMFVGVGTGMVKAGVFHLVTHAFFKACLFLGAGSVIHAMGGRQDMRLMGGLGKKLPFTHWTFAISTAAIMGIFPLSGFWSKDEILAAAWNVPGAAGSALFAIGLLAAACTCFYMMRLYCLVFTGECRADNKTQSRIHESPASMTIPLVVLATGAAVAGLPRIHFSWVGIPATLVALGSIYAAYKMYWGGEKHWVKLFVTTWPRLYRATKNKFRVDELYEWAVVRPLHGIAIVLHQVIDRRVIDGLGVHTAPWIVYSFGWVARRLQNGNVQRYAALVLIGVAVIFYAALGG